MKTEEGNAGVENEQDPFVYIHQANAKIISLNQQNAALIAENEALRDKLRLADKNCDLLRGHRDEQAIDIQALWELVKELTDVLGACEQILITLYYPESALKIKSIIERAKKLTDGK